MNPHFHRQHNKHANAHRSNNMFSLYVNILPRKLYQNYTMKTWTVANMHNSIVLPVWYRCNVVNRPALKNDLPSHFLTENLLKNDPLRSLKIDTPVEKRCQNVSIFNRGQLGRGQFSMLKSDPIYIMIYFKS